jgi:tetratricopeptide (TPR) repeat protein
MRQRNSTRAGRLRATALSFLITSLAAGPALAITVDNVIQMHKSGLPGNVIVQTIEGTHSTFNLTVQDMKTLEAAGVPKDVIEAMMKSTGSAAPAPAPEPAPEPAAEPGQKDDLQRLREQEDKDREAIEEEARIREASRRAADQERQKMAAEESKRIASQLESARDAYEDAEYYRAARLYDEFVQKSDPKKPSALQAKLGLADSLFALKMYGNAAATYHEVVEAGPDNDAFVPAFEGLRRCGQKISYNPVTLEKLTNYFVGNAPKPFQDGYNYYLGKFFFDYNRYDEARKYLAQVSNEGADFSDAQYLLGLMVVLEAGEQDTDERAQKLITASPLFQQAVTAAESKDEDRVAHLSYLALARIAYTVGLYDVAIFYYRKVPTDSTNYVNALYEIGWSYFLKGDVRRGMGIFHTLDGPDWENYFLPDSHLLEATVFMNTCHFDFAHDAVKRMEEKYLALKAPLQKYLAEYTTPETLYRAFVLGQTNKGVELPRLLRMATLADAEFSELYGTVRNRRREVSELSTHKDNLGADLANRLLSSVETQQRDAQMEMGIKISAILQRLDAELTDLEVKLSEIRIEIDEVQADELEKAIKDSYQETSQAAAAAASQRTASVFVGDKYLTWPFEGEYWEDEINAYRSNLTEVCKGAPEQ